MRKKFVCEEELLGSEEELLIREEELLSREEDFILVIRKNVIYK